MAPSGKRKRGGFQDQSDGPSRPSPHRPENLGLAQHNHIDNQQTQNGSGYQNQHVGRGGRRSSRGGRGGHTWTNGSANGQDNGRENIDGETPGPTSDNVDAVTSARQARFEQVNSSASTSTAQLPSTGSAAAPQPALTSGASVLAIPPSVWPYDYEIVTTERVSDWAARGRQDIITAASQACEEDDASSISTILQELLRAGLDGFIQAEEAGKTIEEIFTSLPRDTVVDGPSLFLDTLSVLSELDVANPRIAELVFATSISPDLMREQLDDTLLKTLGLVRQTFDRVFIRKQTGILYRQSNYNLLREESEGYSKLATELFTTTANESSTAEVAKETFENMKALIGAFDLDPGRVLDVTLDVFASLLVKHYRFFIKLLRVSSWWPEIAEDMHSLTADYSAGLPLWAQPGYSHSMLEEDDRSKVLFAREIRDQQFWTRVKEIGMNAFFELGGRKVLQEPEIAQKISEAEEATDSSAAEIRETQNWIRTTKTLPPPGNAVAAQLLGFKLRFYASEARDPSDTLPMNLIYLSALLIKVGFISLRDLYPHLHPRDESMDSVLEKQIKENEERELAKRPGGGQLNALARAGALADDTVPPPVVSRLRETETRAATPSKSDPVGSKQDTPSAKVEEEDKEQLPEASDQKVQLLRSLLCIGAIPEALYLLGRFTWLPNAFPDLPEYLHRILHFALAKVYEPLSPLHDREGLRSAAKIPSTDQSGLPKGELRLTEPPTTKTLRWAQLDKNDTQDGIDYRFYWDEWADNVPVCQNVDDVFAICNTFLNYSGVKIGQDVSLLMKLARIGKHSLSEDNSEANMTRWYDLCKRLLCPALSLTKVNPAVVNDVYDILKNYSTPLRYSVYAEWFGGATSRLPEIKNAFDLVGYQTRDLLKRMSKTNMKPMARSLAKIACASPGVVFTIMLGHVESYDNFVEVIVECGRYFTYMGYDVLTWTLLNALGKEGRDRVSNTGFSASKWLKALAKFSGRIFRRYSVMNTSPVIQYVLEELHLNNTDNLLVLQEILENMAGIAAKLDLNDAQIQAMAGGELLRAQTLRQLSDRRHESRISSKRLLRTLVEHGLAAPLLIAIAQQRQICLFGNEVELKIMGENLDQIQIVLIQYLDLLRTGLSAEDFESLIPDVVTLIFHYGIDVNVAFNIHRRSIARAIEAYDDAHKQSSASRRRSSGLKEVVADAEMVDVASSVGDSTALPVAGLDTLAETVQQAVNDEGVKPDASVSMTDAVSNPTFETPSSTVTTASPWHPVLEDIAKRIEAVASEDFRNTMSIPFYVTFWQLSLHDLTAPYKSYTEEDERQKAKIAALNADRTDISVTGLKRKEQDKKAITDFQAKLVLEMKTHLANYSHVRERLKNEKKYWFKDLAGNVKWKTLCDTLLQECFLPRLLLSPIDAYFTWTMLNMLHSSGTPEFRTMFFLDRLFNEKILMNIIIQCTTEESKNLARFLNEVFRELSAWHTDRNVYEKRAYGSKKELPGFAQSIGKDGTLHRFLEFEDFRRLLFKWHRSLLTCLKTCITSNNWKHINNAIYVGKGIATHFPAVNFMGIQLRTALRTIADDDKLTNTDLWLSANSLIADLKGREKRWVLPQAFYLSDAVPKTQGTSSRSASTAPRSPIPEKAKAESIEPTSAPNVASSAATPLLTISTSTATKPKPSGKPEVEDGELEDGQTATPGGEAANALAFSTTAPANASQTTQTSTSFSAPADSAADLKSRALAAISAKRQQSSVSTTPKLPADSPAPPPAGRPSTPQAPAVALTASRSILPAKVDDDRSATRSRTPQPNQSIPLRPEPSRLASGTPDRPPHILPNRPQVSAPPGGHRLSPPPQGRDVRPNGSHDHVLPDRRSEDARARSGDQRPVFPARPESSAYNDRRNEDPTRGRNTPDGHARYPPDITSRKPDGDANNQSRILSSNQPPNDQHSRFGDRSIVPPHINHPSRQPDHIPSVRAPATADTSIPINPERAALLQQAGHGSGQASERRPNDIRHEDQRREIFSRPQMPDEVNRANERFPPREELPHMGRDNRRPFAHDSRQLPRELLPDQAQNAHRGRPNSRHGFPENEPPRIPEPIQQRQFPRGGTDAGHGRLNQDLSQRGAPPQQDMTYGRLTSYPSSPPELESQPQLRTVSGRSQPQESRANHAGPPQLPADTRGSRGPRIDIGPASADRNTNNRPNSAGSAPPIPIPPPVVDTSGVHPSRLRQIDSAQSTPVQTPIQQQQQLPSPTAPPPPSGPRSNYPRQQTQVDQTLSSPTGPSSNSSQGPPTGPANANPDRRNGARRFAGLNETLQKGGQPAPMTNGPPYDRNTGDHGTSIRGRAGGREGPMAQDNRSMAPPQMPPSGPVNGAAGDYGRRTGPNPTMSNTNSHAIPPQTSSQTFQTQPQPPVPGNIRSEVVPADRMGDTEGRNAAGHGRDDRPSRGLREDSHHRTSRDVSRDRDSGRGSDRGGRSIIGSNEERDRDQRGDVGRELRSRDRGHGERNRERERDSDRGRGRADGGLSSAPSTDLVTAGGRQLRSAAATGSQTVPDRERERERERERDSRAASEVGGNSRDRERDRDADRDRPPRGSERDNRNSRELRGKANDYQQPPVQQDQGNRFRQGGGTGEPRGEPLRQPPQQQQQQHYMRGRDGPASSNSGPAGGGSGGRMEAGDGRKRPAWTADLGGGSRGGESKRPRRGEM